MNKKCARCLKTVYPLEELKCFDKIWHKSCFRCTECGMLLTLKNYRGHNRMPYCNAHVPKLQATPIASTPELRRLTNNTRLQSDRKYHEDYELGKKGVKSATSKESKTIRSKESAKLQANVAYRICKFEHSNIVEQRKRELLKGASSSNGPASLVNLYQAKARPYDPLPLSDSCQSSYSNFSESPISTVRFPTHSSTSQRKLKKISSQNGGSSRADINSSSSKKIRLNAGNSPENLEEIFSRRNETRRQLSVSSINFDFADENALGTNDLDGDNNLSSATLRSPSSKLLKKPTSEWIQKDRLDELNDFMNIEKIAEKRKHLQDEIIEPEPSTSSRQQPVEVERKSSTTKFPTFLAIYDFEAKEPDEVSFREGDVIFQVEKENSGWITGRVERTGKIGLLPVTYMKRRIEIEKNMPENNFKENIDRTLDDVE